MNNALLFRIALVTLVGFFTVWLAVSTLPGSLSEQEQTLTSAIVVRFGSVFISAIAALWVWLEQKRSEKFKEKQELAEILFGELVCIWRHYDISRKFIIKELQSADLSRTISRARYGELIVFENLTKYGFLGTAAVVNLIELRLRIRNTDDDFTKCIAPPEENNSIIDRDLVNYRVNLVQETTLALLEDIKGQYPKIGKTKVAQEIFKDIEAKKEEQR